LKASIIIAAKDAEDFIHTALASALAQTMPDLEVIVIDDGSSDGTGNVARRFQALDPRVVLLQNARSMGVSAARNRGLEIARGDWIAILDADDEYATDRLARMVPLAEARGLDLLADNLMLRELGGSTPDETAYPEVWMADARPLGLQDLLERDRPDSPYAMFGLIKPILRRGFLHDARLRYREDVWCAEDFLLYAEALLHGAAFGVMSAALYIRYWRAGSLSADRPALHKEVSRVNRIVAAVAREIAPEMLPMLRKRQAELDYVAASRALRARDFAMAAGMTFRVPLPVLTAKLARAISKRATPRQAV
jgi:glycosyltransferase involved in cell wall biosynthesis